MVSTRKFKAELPKLKDEECSTEKVAEYKNYTGKDGLGEVGGVITKEKVKRIGNLKRVRILGKEAIEKLIEKQKIAVAGNWTRELRYELGIIKELSRIRVDLEVVGIDPTFDHERRSFRITEYDGAHNAYIPNSAEIVAATHCAYGHTLTPPSYSLPSIYRVAVFQWIAAQFRLAFFSIAGPYAEILETLYERIENIPVHLYHRILSSIPECKDALEIGGLAWPHDIVGRLALVPYLANGKPELSEAVDLLALECMLSDAIIVVGERMGCGVATRNLSALLGWLKAFGRHGQAKDLEWFFEFVPGATKELAGKK